MMMPHRGHSAAVSGRSARHFGQSTGPIIRARIATSQPLGATNTKAKAQQGSGSCPKSVYKLSDSFRTPVLNGSPSYRVASATPFAAFAMSPATAFGCDT